MVLDWLGKGKGAGQLTVADLMVRKQYTKAIELAESQYKARPRDARVRLQLADALIAGGRGKDAVALLREVADELASDGFAAKSIAILKRIQKIEPTRAREVDERLATLIEQRSIHQTPIGLVRPAAQPVLGMEIGFEPSPRVPVVPREAEAAPPAAGGGSEWFADATQAEPVPPAPAQASPEPDMEVDLETLLEDEAAGAAPMSTPLFPHFSKDELVLLMRGLELLSFDPGDIIVAQGEPGDSLFIITTGVIKAWVKDDRGHYDNVRSLRDGDFFGEISILTGQPRTATVTAASRCEMLELDRRTLDGITATHPHVVTVLQQFYEQRTGRPLPARG
jgi:hypothetical protein